VLHALSSCTCCRHYPGAADGRNPRSYPPVHISLPRKGCRVGLHIGLFGDCSAFTHVAACTLARSPIRDPLPEGFRHSSPPCLLRLLPAGAMSPGGPRTHWKAPPSHGAHPLQTFPLGGRYAGGCPLPSSPRRFLIATVVKCADFPHREMNAENLPNTSIAARSVDLCRLSRWDRLQCIDQGARTNTGAAGLSRQGVARGARLVPSRQHSVTASLEPGSLLAAAEADRLQRNTQN
jgi:hypothetical protein